MQQPCVRLAGRDDHDRRSGTRARSSPRTASACASRPSLTASVRLPARRSVSMSRMLFTTRIAAASSPTGDSEVERPPASGPLSARSRSRRPRPVRRTGRRTARRDPRSRRGAGRPCRARREDRRGADQQQLPADQRDQVEARRNGDPEREPGRDQHLPRRHQPAGRDAHRPEALLRVGPAARVRVVVREVRPDLDEHASRSAPRRTRAGGTRPRMRRAPCRRGPARPQPAGFAAGRRSPRCAAASVTALRAPGELREVGPALLDVGVAALLGLLGHVEEQRRVAGQLLDAGEAVRRRR